MLLEVPTKQGVEKGINAAAGVAEAEGDVVAHVEGQGRLRNLKICELDHMERGSTHHKHADQSKRHLSEPHDSAWGYWWCNCKTKDHFFGLGKSRWENDGMDGVY